MPDINPNSIYHTRMRAEDDPYPSNCGACDAHVPQGEGTHVRTTNQIFHRTVLCDSCAEDFLHCSYCGRHVHEDRMHEENVDNYSDAAICDDCLDSFSWCEYCETNRSLEDHDFDHLDDSYDDDDGVHSYCYKPDPLFFIKFGRPGQYRPDKPTDVFTGFELEVECERAPRRDATEVAQEIFGDVAYLKHDGSLDNGFEIVSHPMSLDFVRNGVDWERVRELARMGVRSAQTSTCGLHIHVSRAWMTRSPALQYRFMSLFYNNVSQWQSLAGRSQSSYAVWSNEERDNMLRYAKNLKHSPGSWDSGNHNRYVALNLQGPHTIELRFFKGTLKPSTLLARIEAVHAVAQYVKESQCRLPATSVHQWERFRNWTVDNKFKAFDAYATEKGV